MLSLIVIKIVNQFPPDYPSAYTSPHPAGDQVSLRKIHHQRKNITYLRRLLSQASIINNTVLPIPHWRFLWHNAQYFRSCSARFPYAKTTYSIASWQAALSHSETVCTDMPPTVRVVLLGALLGIRDFCQFPLIHDCGRGLRSLSPSPWLCDGSVTFWWPCGVVVATRGCR
jgi:hypothetical protein